MTAYRLISSRAERPRNGEILFRVGDNLSTGRSQFHQQLGTPTSLEIDLLNVSAGVFAADRATARGPRERLAREIALEIPVVNAGRLTALIPALEKVLRRLSSDSWEIAFTQLPGQPEDIAPVEDLGGSTLLFSGGLDSLAAAVRLHQGAGPQLVSHVTHNRQTRLAQDSLILALADRGLDLPHLRFFVSSRSDPTQGLEHSAETSQRTRSFLFLVLGALCARRTGRLEVLYLAENGQMAIHLPLTHGRIGAFSTHTAHPDVLAGMEEFLQPALNAPITIRNPFVHETKAEVIRTLVTDHPALVWIAESCWKNARLPAGRSHCGECVPCLVRRIAVEHAGVPDETAYARDLLNQDVSALPPVDIGRRNLVDLLEFVRHVSTLRDDEMANEWPELYSPNVDRHSVINMYRRFAAEASSVLGRYAGVVPLLR